MTKRFCIRYSPTKGPVFKAFDQEYSLGVLLTGFWQIIILVGRRIGIREATNATSAEYHPPERGHRRKKELGSLGLPVHRDGEHALGPVQIYPHIVLFASLVFLNPRIPITDFGLKGAVSIEHKPDGCVAFSVLKLNLQRTGIGLLRHNCE